MEIGDVQRGVGNWELNCMMDGGVWEFICVGICGMFCSDGVTGGRELMGV